MTSEFDPHIKKFIKKHHVLTLATVADNKPWCANCFYALLDDEGALVFTSDVQTRHIKEALNNAEVAGSIVLETKIVGKIQGLQFTGTLTEPKDEIAKKARHAYLKRFPYAALMNTTLWVLIINHAKMTDNNLGFGKKLLWNRE
jgi:uncharacterized protein YhbP (UPF0306 family)